MIPDARLWAPVGTPKCECLEKMKAEKYLNQYMCEECEPLIVKIERKLSEELHEARRG